MTLLLRVPVGSVLTGFAVPTSDIDWIEVYDKHTSQHHKKDGLDVTRWDLSTFTRILNDGGHNALEACFAPDHLYDVDLLRDWRHSFHADPYKVWWRYKSTIKGSSRSLASKPLKAQIFAERLMFDRQACMIGEGRYDPTAFRRTTRGEDLYQARLANSKEAL